MYSCKFSQKSVVNKLQIGSSIIFLKGMKIIHICNFLTIIFYENLQEYFFFIQNQFLIMKNEKKTKILNNEFSIWPTAAILKKHVCTGGIAWFFLW